MWGDIFLVGARGETIRTLVQIAAHGRLPAQISFLAGNLREAVLGRRGDQLRQSRAAAEALGESEGPGLAADTFARERWELLSAVSASLDEAKGQSASLDEVALSQFASQLSLLESLSSQPPVTSVRYNPES